MRAAAAKLALAMLALGTACGWPPKPPDEVTAAAPVLRWIVEDRQPMLGAEVRARLWLALPEPVGAVDRGGGAGSLSAPGEPLSLSAVLAGGDPLAALPEIEGLRIAPSDPGRRFHRDGHLYWTRGYSLRWLRLGTRTLPAVPLAETRTEAGLATEPLDFEVRGALGEAPGFEPVLPEGLVLDPPPPSPLPWILGGIGVLAALAVGLVLVRRLRPSMRPIDSGPLRSPADRARDRLAELERALDRGALDGEPFVREVGAVLRFYLQDGLDLPSRARTTEELLAGLDDNHRFALDVQRFLDGYLRQCDLVKFAAQGADPALCRSLLDRTRDFVDEQDRRVHGAAAVEEGGHG